MILNSYISADEVIASIVSQIGDEDYSYFSKGWYMSRINDCINSLAIDFLYNKETEDFYDWNKEGICRFELNSNVIDIKEIYLFNRTCTDGVNTDGAFQSVVWKRLHNNFNKFETAKIHNRNRSMANNRAADNYRGSELLYCNIQNGELIFCSKAENYNTLRLVYSGFPYEKGVFPTIPVQFKDYVSGYVQEKALMSIKNKDKSRRTDWADISAQVYSNRGASPSLKVEAERRAKNLNTFQRESLNDNFGSPIH